MKNFSVTTLILTLAIVGLGSLSIYLSNYQNPSLTVIQAHSSLVSGFPSFPFYPKATIESSQYNKPVAANSYRASYQAFLESTDSVPVVIGWTENALIANGYSIDQKPDPATPDDQNISFSKGSIKGTINADTEGTNTSIVVSIMNK